MQLDLSELLNDWPYEPGKLNVRMIETAEGVPLLQIRLDLGILQMQVDGRPDGQRPFGYESMLEALEARVDEARSKDAPTPEASVAGDSAMDSEEDTDEPGDEDQTPLDVLTPGECQALREEAAQYSHRYLALLAVEEFDRVVRDTTRNLRVIDFIASNAADEEDRRSLDQFRAYITMMRARALASLALRDNEPKAALYAIDEGLEALQRHFDESDQAELFDESSEVRMLRDMRTALVPKLPVSQRAELHQRLDEAVQQENYKLAAILRDELKLLGELGDPNQKPM